jgi:hypothetical protein
VKEGLLQILNEGDLGLTESQWRARVMESSASTQKRKDTSAKSQTPISTHQASSMLFPQFSARSWCPQKSGFRDHSFSLLIFFHPKDKVLGGV